MIYYRRVLVAVAKAKQQQTLTNKVNYELLEEILDSIKVAVEDQKYSSSLIWVRFHKKALYWVSTAFKSIFMPPYSPIYLQ